MTPRSALRSAGLLALGLLVLGCSPDAREMLEKYEVVFEECKKLTEEAGVEPGTHFCTKLSSMALEKALDDTEIDRATRDEMIGEWKSSNPLGEFYADETARAAIPDL
jgi:hypothetical protein